MKPLAVLFDPRRLPSWLAATAVLVSAFLLAADDGLLGPLGLDRVRADHRSTLGWALVVGAAFLLVASTAFVLRRAVARRLTRRRLVRFDVTEQAVLREFTLQGRQTIAAPANALAVAGLLTDGVLRQVGGQMQPTPQGLVAAIRIDPLARRLLEPAAIGLTSFSPPEAERRRLIDQRPAFVGEVARWDALFNL